LGAKIIFARGGNGENKSIDIRHDDLLFEGHPITTATLPLAQPLDLVDRVEHHFDTLGKSFKRLQMPVKLGHPLAGIERIAFHFGELLFGASSRSPS
jgi:hypothetical protein